MQKEDKRGSGMAYTDGSTSRCPQVFRLGGGNQCIGDHMWHALRCSTVDWGRKDMYSGLYMDMSRISRFRWLP